MDRGTVPCDDDRDRRQARIVTRAVIRHVPGEHLGPAMAFRARRAAKRNGGSSGVVVGDCEVLLGGEARLITRPTGIVVIRPGPNPVFAGRQAIEIERAAVAPCISVEIARTAVQSHISAGDSGAVGDRPANGIVRAIGLVHRVGKGDRGRARVVVGDVEVVPCVLGGALALGVRGSDLQPVVSQAVTRLLVQRAAGGSRVPSRNVVP